MAHEDNFSCVKMYVSGAGLMLSADYISQQSSS